MDGEIYSSRIIFPDEFFRDKVSDLPGISHEYSNSEATSADKHNILGYQLFKDNYAKKMRVKVKSGVKSNVSASNEEKLLHSVNSASFARNQEYFIWEGQL